MKAEVFSQTDVSGKLTPIHQKKYNPKTENMTKEIWRENWLNSINELTDLNVQKQSWLNEKLKSPHWSFAEFMCSYFDDLFGSLNYDHFVSENWITENEYLIIKDWHKKLDKYKSPSENEWADNLILNDGEWLEILKIGEVAKCNLAKILSESEKQILEKNLINEIE
jgi:hypothetical protein